MRIKNIASGSSGNATYIGSDDTHILIDCGISRKRINEGLNEIGLTVKDLDAILITHEHIDHIATVGVLERTAPIPLYATAGTMAGINATKSCGDFDRSVFRNVKADREFDIGDIHIRPLTIWHDANEPVCYRFESGGKSLAVVTDLGDYDEYLVDNLQGLDGVLIEANHDEHMLEVGPYPYPVKQRILSRYGHLSNERSGQLLSELLHDHMQYIMLGHISRENNTKDLARLTVVTEIEAADNIYRGSDFDIMVARRHHTSLMAEI